MPRALLPAPCLRCAGLWGCRGAPADPAWGWGCRMGAKTSPRARTELQRGAGVWQGGAGPVPLPRPPSGAENPAGPRRVRGENQRPAGVPPQHPTCPQPSRCSGCATGPGTGDKPASVSLSPGSSVAPPGAMCVHHGGGGGENSSLFSFCLFFFFFPLLPPINFILI